jgi:hypothetical protein
MAKRPTKTSTNPVETAADKNLVPTPTAELPHVGEPAPEKAADTATDRQDRIDARAAKKDKPIVHPLEALRQKRDALKKELKEVERELRNAKITSL